MKVGMIGLGRMGEGMSRRLIKNGHEVWGYRNNYEKSCEQYEAGYISGCTTSIQSLVQVIHSYKSVSERKPGIFMMVVPAETVEETINELLRYCREGDIIIDHGNDYMTLYAHNKELLREAGDWIQSGEVISRAGNTGGLTNTALYFEIRDKGKPVNPKIWLRKR